jgi:hypothetical protein
MNEQVKYVYPKLSILRRSWGSQGLEIDDVVQENYGLTLRDYFAAAALQSMNCIRFDYETNKDDPGHEVYREASTSATARAAYEYADALLKARGQ